MPRYIDADIALDKMKKWHTQERLMDCVRDTPTADVVSVVRCKDCRNRFEKNWSKCRGRKPDDYCSDGERRLKNG